MQLLDREDIFKANDVKFYKKNIKNKEMER